MKKPTDRNPWAFLLDQMFSRPTFAPGGVIRKRDGNQNCAQRWFGNRHKRAGAEGIGASLSEVGVDGGVVVAGDETVEVGVAAEPLEADRGRRVQVGVDDGVVV